MDLLFVHSAGPQGGEEGSAPLLRALRRELGDEAHIAAPLMPNPDAPDAAAWNLALAGYIEALQEPFVAVGHSLGGSTLLGHFAVHAVPRRLLGMVCIATPFWGMPGWAVQEFALPEGFGARLAALPRLVFYHSSDDDVVAPSHLDRYGTELPQAELRQVSGRGHAFAGVPIADIAGDIRSMPMAPNSAAAGGL